MAEKRTRARDTCPHYLQPVLDKLIVRALGNCRFSSCRFKQKLARGCFNDSMYGDEQRKNSQQLKHTPHSRNIFGDDIAQPEHHECAENEARVVGISVIEVEGTLYSRVDSQGEK